MARPGLTLHRKFKWLALQLGSPYAARGVLELLWEAAYESGEERVGYARDIAVAVGWQGDPEVLARALCDAGGPDCAGFIELIPEEPGRYRIHDLYDHAPGYVVTRMQREIERVQRGQSISDVRREAGRKGAAAKAARKQNSANEIHLPGKISNLLVEGQQTQANVLTPAPALSDPPKVPQGGQFALVPQEPEPPPLPGKPRKGDRETIDHWRKPAEDVLGFFNARRMEVIRGARPVSPSYETLAGIAARLAAGKTVPECLAVIETCAAEVRAGGDAKWFTTGTTFRTQNFQRKLEIGDVVGCRAPAPASPVRNADETRALIERQRAAPAIQAALPQPRRLA